MGWVKLEIKITSGRASLLALLKNDTTAQGTYLKMRDSAIQGESTAYLTLK